MVFNLAKEDGSKLDYWLCSIAARGAGNPKAVLPPVVIVGTHWDTEYCSKEVLNHLLERLKQKYAHYPNIKKWLVVDNQTRGKGRGKWIKELRTAITEVAYAHSMVGYRIPPSYLHLMKYVDAERARLKKEGKVPVIMWSDLEEDALRSLGISPFEFSEALRFLNSIGEVVQLREPDASKAANPSRRGRSSIYFVFFFGGGEGRLQNYSLFR